MAAPVRVALAPGDGIGPEITDAVLAVFEAAGVVRHVEFVPVEMGRAVFERGDSRGVTDEALAAVEDCGIVFKGPMETPKGGGGKSINVTLRKLYCAYANIRHFRALPGVETVFSRAGVPVNFYVVRENVEDTYGGIEHRLTNDVIECKRLVSAPGCDQVHRAAFELARRLGLSRVTCGHKANIMKMTDGLFLERFHATAADYPGIRHEDVIIDALCMNLVLRPHTYELVVLPNLQGDIVSDLAAGLVGGLGFAPSANIGQHVSIFEAVHGSAPDIAGKGVANPTSLLLSGLMMLRHVGLVRIAATVENALLATLEDGVRTADFGDPAREPVGTMPFAREIVSRLGRAPRAAPAVPVPERDTAPFTRPERPRINTLIRTFTQVVSHHAGCDVYIETTISPAELAAHLERLCEHSPFTLTMMSNRGTQVWPSGSVFTEVVDYYRVRFELRNPAEIGRYGQSAAIALLGRIAEKFPVTDFQPLKVYDGKPGFSLAQGQ
ncbi:MAG: NADP-dependent isocitrate dehydrogenase [Phycisphaerales bacterium]|nr:NADP-dependent isocitrate dehydrogenase [Phycisphaerales bacterium]